MNERQRCDSGCQQLAARVCLIVIDASLRIDRIRSSADWFQVLVADFRDGGRLQSSHIAPIGILLGVLDVVHERPKYLNYHQGLDIIVKKIW